MPAPPRKRKAKLTALELAAVRQRSAVTRWKRELEELHSRHKREEAKLIQKIDDACTVLRALSPIGRGRGGAR